MFVWHASCASSFVSEERPPMPGHEPIQEPPDPQLPSEVPPEEPPSGDAHRGTEYIYAHRSTARYTRPRADWAPALRLVCSQ